MAAVTVVKVKDIDGHEVGRRRSGGWSQFYVETPEGNVGLIDDWDWEMQGLPESCQDITADHISAVINAVWYWIPVDEED